MTRRTTGWIGALAAAALLTQAAPALADPPPHARAWGERAHDWDDHGRDYDARHDGRYDRDCDHGAYPRYGYVVRRLPAGYRMVHYRGDRYYWHRDVWYRPYGARYVVVAPPMRGYYDHHYDHRYDDRYDHRDGDRDARRYVDRAVPVVR